MTFGLNAFGLLKACIECQPTHHVATFLHPKIFGSDRWLTKPLLQTQHRFIVTLLNLLVDRSEIRSRMGLMSRKHCAGGGSPGDEIAACERHASIRWWIDGASLHRDGGVRFGG